MGIVDYKLLEKWEQEALAYVRDDNPKEAARLFRKIIDVDPAYDDGMCLYNLACHLDDLDDLEEAEKYYLQALEYSPSDPIRLGGYASFLYRHGSAREAFEAHLKLLKVRRLYKLARVNEIILVLQRLGKKLGLTDEEIQKRIDEP